MINRKLKVDKFWTIPNSNFKALYDESLKEYHRLGIFGEDFEDIEDFPNQFVHKDSSVWDVVKKFVVPYSNMIETNRIISQAIIDENPQSLKNKLFILRNFYYEMESMVAKELVRARFQAYKELYMSLIQNESIIQTTVGVVKKYADEFMENLRNYRDPKSKHYVKIQEKSSSMRSLLIERRDKVTLEFYEQE